MSPLKLKQPSATVAPSSTETHLLLRETLRITTNLSSNLDKTSVTESKRINNGAVSQSRESHATVLQYRRLPGLMDEDQLVNSTSNLICFEEIDGRRWKYVTEREDSGRFGKSSIRAVSLQTPLAPVDEFMSFIRSYVVPEGFPDSVSPSYVPYMKWRALKYFFGGAMGVLTTQSLLASVGVSRNASAPAAATINWILKDGAGRIGKMLYARQGKKFDYDLKRLRFSGDILMELAAGVELATTAMPHLFLPLACAANVVKNVATVTSTSTRTSIYKAFAKGENTGDITAKGECVANIADLLGIGMSIMISKRAPSLITPFALISCGYLFSAYQEVRSVVMDTLNHARFTVAVESFMKTGRVPSLQEGNMQERIFGFPWMENMPVVLGSRFKDAFQDPSSYHDVAPFFKKERYIVTYNPSKSKVYAVFKDQAKSDDILKAAFHAYALLHFMHASNRSQCSNQDPQNLGQSDLVPATFDIKAHIAESCKMVSTSYDTFKRKASEQGWRMADTLLNPGRARIS